MSTAPVTALPALYDFILWISAKISAFPRNHRFTVGDRLMTALLDILDRLIEAQYTPSARRVALQRANVALERARYLLRLSKDLNCLSLKEYEFACGNVLTVGRMIGGWLRQQTPTPPAAV